MAEKELTVEEKLRTLYDLQLIDSRIDEIRAIQGELPLQVQELEDEIEGLSSRLEKLKEEQTTYQTQVKVLKTTIQEAKDLMERYHTQQKNVRNNREYDSISKEIEFQSLEIQHAEKLIKEVNAKLELQAERIASNEEKLAQMGAHLGFKQSELDSILAETKKEQEALQIESDKIAATIEPSLLTSYKKIRARVRNGLAVVSIDRGASGGSFFTIPPQRQMEIATRKKIIADEHSGRILVDADLATEEREKMENIFKNILA